MIRNKTILRNKIAKHLRDSGVSYQVIENRIIIMDSNGDYHYCAVDVICDSLDWYAKRKPFTFYVVCPRTTKDGINAINKYLEQCKQYRQSTRRYGI